MTANSTHKIAERYARALFSSAEKANALDAIEADMQALTSAMGESEVLQQFIANPLFSRAQKSKAMEAVVGKMKAHALTQQFVKQLAQGRRLKALAAITVEVERLMREKRGEQLARVVSAKTLEEKQKDALQKALSKSTGKPVQLVTSEDESLLGGLIVSIGGTRYDYSMRGALARLKRELKTGGIAA